MDFPTQPPPPAPRCGLAAPPPGSRPRRHHAPHNHDPAASTTTFAAARRRRSPVALTMTVPPPTSCVTTHRPPLRRAWPSQGSRGYCGALWPLRVVSWAQGHCRLAVAGLLSRWCWRGGNKAGHRSNEPLCVKYEREASRPNRDPHAARSGKYGINDAPASTVVVGDPPRKDAREPAWC